MPNRENGERISKLLGNLLELELREEGALYFRMKNDVNLEAPLTPSFPLKMKNGTTNWVDVNMKDYQIFVMPVGEWGMNSKPMQLNQSKKTSMVHG